MDAIWWAPQSKYTLEVSQAQIFGAMICATLLLEDPVVGISDWIWLNHGKNVVQTTIIILNLNIGADKVPNAHSESR